MNVCGAIESVTFLLSEDLLDQMDLNSPLDLALYSYPNASLSKYNNHWIANDKPNKFNVNSCVTSMHHSDCELVCKNVKSKNKEAYR